jgi:hypothetical protein
MLKQYAANMNKYTIINNQIRRADRLTEEERAAVGTMYDDADTAENALLEQRAAARALGSYDLEELAAVLDRLKARK